MNEDAEMIRQPHRWPQWPFLPVIRRKKDGTDYGVIPAVEHDPELKGGNELHHIRVYHVLLTAFPRSQEELDRTPYDEYKSPLAATEDGWIVD